MPYAVRPRFDGSWRDDPFIREKFTKERSAAGTFAKEYFERYPKDRYQTEVEGWRHLQSSNIEFNMKKLRAFAAARKAYGAEMKTFARFLLVGTMLLARCAWATDPSPVAFAKSVVSEHGSQTFATVSYPDRSLIVEFRLEPYSDGKATAVRAFGEITKKIAQGAFSKFPKIKSVQLIGNLALRDKHGNDTVDRAVMVKFSKASASTIKWENVDPANVVEIADKHWILPELGADKN